jgi:hypothetical protein
MVVSSDPVEKKKLKTALGAPLALIWWVWFDFALVNHCDLTV